MFSKNIDGEIAAPLQPATDGASSDLQGPVEPSEEINNSENSEKQR